ncbi:MAG: CRISPR-associated CARF protein Csa3 [Thermoprotei archaeon]|jgi:CRISPR locus-related DNA-binding protein
MRKLIIATIGFEEKFTVRMITRHGLDKGDKVLLLTGPPTEKSTIAINLVREFITKYYSKDVTLLVREIPVHNFYDAVHIIKQNIMNEAKGVTNIVVNLSGGMRILIIETLLALTVLSVKNITVEIETEDSSTIITIPTEFISMKLPIRKRHIEILQILAQAQEPITIKTIAEELKIDDSTIRRHLLKLRKMRLVEVKKGKPLLIQLSPLAKLLM